MLTRSGSVLRFAVVASDGRRSNDWRIWTTTAGKPSDELYVAPRMASGTHKISLHADGYSQHGPERKLRDLLPPGERGAFERWTANSPLANGWTIRLVLQFFESQLLSIPDTLDSRVIQVPAPAAGRTMAVLVITTSEVPRDEQLGPLRVVGCLERRSTGSVLVATLDLPAQDELIETAHSHLMDPYSNQAFPLPLSKGGDFAWAVGEMGDGTPFVSEISVPNQVRKSIFQGRVSPWSDLPKIIRPPKDLDLCAVLHVSAEGAATLYANHEHRDCSPGALAQSANELVAAIRRGEADDGWSRLADGSYVTALIGAPEM